MQKSLKMELAARVDDDYSFVYIQLFEPKSSLIFNNIERDEDE